MDSLEAQQQNSRVALLLLAGGIVAFLSHSLISFPAHVVGSSLEFIAFCGLALSLSYGTSLSFTWVLDGWKGKTVHILLIVVGLTVSGFAAADIRANWLMERGIDQVQAGLYAAGEGTLQKSLSPDFAPRQTYYYLAVAQIHLGKLDEAQGSLEKCMTRFIDEASLLNYANLLVNTGQSERAFEPLDLLLASRPRRDIQRRAKYLRALAISETGDPEGAILLIEDLLKDNPSYVTPLIGLGSIYESLDRIEEARSSYSEGLEKIEIAIAKIRATIAAIGETATAEEAGELQAQISRLTYERATLLERLRLLPDGTSP
ncbi:tetratricopeptide repeat protein [Candidatus Bipolaricaulota bacterium]|nr:tetratricopeptide repeat protein [Candidatus Bipolaricaulota bacterium]